MNYRLNVLNTASFIFIAGCIVYTVLKYKTLSAGEGWGVVSMVGLMGIAFVSLVVELILQIFVKNRKALNIAECCLLLFLGLLIFLD